MAIVSASTYYDDGHTMGRAGWYVATNTMGEGEMYPRIGPHYGPYSDKGAALSQAESVLKGAGMYTAQAIYLSDDELPLRVLYAAACEPNFDAMYAHMFEHDVFVNVIDVRPWAPMAGPDFDCYHDEHSKQTCEHFAASAAIGRLPTIAIPEDVTATSRARELLRSVAPLDALDRAVGTQWSVPSWSNSSKTHTVTVRPDTRNGGTYLYCTCIGWGPQRGRGKNCRHVEAVINGEGVEK